MSIFRDVREQAIANKHKREEGKDLVIPWLNFPKLSTVIPGVQRERYVIITSGPKSGKSQLTDTLYVMEPINYLLKNPNTNLDVEIHFFTLEMSKEAKIKQLIANKIYIETGKIISSENLDSLYRNYILEDEIAVELFTESYEKWFDFLESHVTYIDNVRNPTGIYFHMREVARKNGKFFYKGKEVIIPESANWSQSQYQYDDYIPNNPDKFIICIVDHVGLLTPEDKRDLEGTIDLFSNTYAIKLRDKFRQTIITVQQQNLGAEDQVFSQGKLVIAKVKPRHSSLGDSKKPSRDCNQIISLFNPSRFSIPEYPEKNGYDVTKWKDHYRELSILLSRNGGGSIDLDLYFNGAVNYFEELPSPEKFKKDPNLYKKYLG